MIRAKTGAIIRLVVIISLSLTFVPVYTQTNDTLQVYKKIKKYAYKSRFSKFLYHTIFVDPSPHRYEKKPLSDNQRRQNRRLAYNGKIIRSITIETNDPFGYTIHDTSYCEVGALQALGNRVHLTTQNFVVRNLLLFKENDTVDMFTITESERIMREAGYINDARIFFLSGPADDSADIKVVVLDKWSIKTNAVVTSTTGRVLLRDINLLGLGQFFEQTVAYSPRSKDYRVAGRYNIGNIDHTFISGDLFYNTTRDETEAGFAFNRPLYSAIAKWAGGVSAGKKWGYYSYTDSLDQSEKKIDLDYYTYDIWAAKSIGLPTKRGISRYSNIILALRHANIYYEHRPPFTLDTNRVNAHARLYLGSLGYTHRKYYKDQFIYRFGANEDIPEGWLVQWLYGIIHNEVHGLIYYTGSEISRGKHIDGIGYLSGNVAYGTTYNVSMAHNSTLNAGITYFSDLYENRRWYFRQFAYYKIVYGFNKNPYERIYFSPNELYGFGNNLPGTAKMVLNLETVMYAPYNFIGFKFAPLVLAGFGMIDTDNRNILTSPFYQAYAIGLLIRNENLLTSSFQITFGLYPTLPDGNPQWFRLNPITNFTFRVRGFAIGKPGLVAFE